MCALRYEAPVSDDLDWVFDSRCHIFQLSQMYSSIERQYDLKSRNFPFLVSCEEFHILFNELKDWHAFWIRSRTSRSAPPSSKITEALHFFYFFRRSTECMYGLVLLMRKRRPLYLNTLTLIQLVRHTSQGAVTILKRYDVSIFLRRC